MKQGLLLVDKPEQWTSFDAVNYVRRMMADIEHVKPKAIKVGHCGTLDPFATGLLILLIGKDYTRRASEFSKLDKTYTFEIVLGMSSTTGDPTGRLKEISSYEPTETELEGALMELTGTIKQLPPVFSAIKINGVRSYKLARRGEHAPLEPRDITIHSLSLISYKYPVVTLKANVSSGTYIRSLGEDIGERLKTGAYVKTLRRNTIGSFDVGSAQKVKELSLLNVEQFIKPYEKGTE